MVATSRPMTHRRLRPALLPLVLSLWLAALWGCSAAPTLRVVDAKSKEPVGDVRVERLEGGYHPSAMPFVIINDLSPAEKQTTDAAGSVKFQKNGSQFMVNPDAANPGYNDAYVKLNWSGATVLYPNTYHEFSVPAKDGVVEIPLRRRWSGDAAPAKSDHRDP
jgi:hypothetical protein